MKIALAGLCTAAIAFAAITVNSPAQAAPGQPCATPDGSVTQACTDCLNAKTNDGPATIADKCGYPGTVASSSVPQTPQGQNP